MGRDLVRRLVAVPTATRVTVVGAENTSGDRDRAPVRGATISGSGRQTPTNGQGISRGRPPARRAEDEPYYDEDDCGYVRLRLAVGTGGSYQFTSVAPGEYRLRAFTTSRQRMAARLVRGAPGLGPDSRREAVTPPAGDIVLARVPGSRERSAAPVPPARPACRSRRRRVPVPPRPTITRSPATTPTPPGPTLRPAPGRGPTTSLVSPPRRSPWMRTWFDGAATRARSHGARGHCGPVRDRRRTWCSPGAAPSRDPSPAGGEPACPTSRSASTTRPPATGSRRGHDWHRRRVRGGWPGRRRVPNPVRPLRSLGQLAAGVERRTAAPKLTADPVAVPGRAGEHRGRGARRRGQIRGTVVGHGRCCP